MALLDVDVDGTLSVEISLDPLSDLHSVVPSVEHLLRPLHPPLGKDNAHDLLGLLSIALHSLQLLQVHICQFIDRAFVTHVEGQAELRPSTLLRLDKD